MPRMIVGICGLWWWAATLDDYNMTEDMAFGWTENGARLRCARKHTRRLEKSLDTESWL